MNDIERIEKLIENAQEVIDTYKPNPPNFFGFSTLDYGAFNAWRSQCLHFLESKLQPTDPYISEFQDKVTKGFKGHVLAGIGILRAFQGNLAAGETYAEEISYNPIRLIENICDQFHLVARQMRSRYNDRPTLDVADEYDVQDLIHSLLHLYFIDIRPEEVTPSYAGKSARIDFLLKPEQIVIEIKKTRDGLGAKELGSQLIEDIARYNTHPDCEILICFVYDPEGRVANPRGIENDLRRVDGKPVVEVWIRP